MDAMQEDEKKPLVDAAMAADDSDQQSDPDEHLMLDQGNGAVWSVRVRQSTFARQTKLRFALHPRSRNTFSNGGKQPLLAERRVRCSLQCRELVTYRPLAHLATLRVYQNFYGNRKHRIILFLPPNVDPRKCVRTDSLTRPCTHLRYSPSQTPPAQNPRHPQFDFGFHFIMWVGGHPAMALVPLRFC